jgi:putative transposase
VSTVRDGIVSLINDARATGARQAAACEVIGISAKTYQRWDRRDNTGDSRQDAGHTPANKLSALERQRIIKLVDEPEYADLAPSQIVLTLADEGRYIDSESTLYRILRGEKQLHDRQTSKLANAIKNSRALKAAGANQIYTWDITYLPTRVRGVILYLYVVLDIYSRKIVGLQVHDEERSVLAAELMTDICQREGIQRHQVTLHSDNGSPMNWATMLATLQQLGIMPSFSRPSVSNDTSYSESLFCTLKYRPNYPAHPFAGLHAARVWVHGFVEWYNYEHRHSAIKFVTPVQRHAGEDAQILAYRKQVYKQARSEKPLRWSGEIRNW